MSPETIDRASTPRTEVDTAACWNLSHIYPDREAWERERDALSSSLGELDRFRGTLATDAASLATALDALMAIEYRLERLHHYASRLRDQDVAQAGPAAMADTMTKLGAEVSAAASFFEPEILSIDDGTLRAWMKDERFADYDRYLNDILRKKAHILSAGEEKVLANASTLGTVTYYTYSTFSDSELKHPTIVDHEGHEIEVNSSTYRRLRQSPVREDRKRAFEALWTCYHDYRNTFAHLLSGGVSYNSFVAKSRNHDSVLAMALHDNEVPVAFYHTLIDRVRDHLPSFHRYLSLRQKLLGIEGKQHYYDIYPSVVPGIDRTYPIDQCYGLTLDAMKPMGDDYLSHLREAFKADSGWIDVYPNKGKRSGAYMAGCYDLHPYVLLNHNDDFESLSTLVHEMGHALHSVYSQATQPYHKADYSIFVAEVASTLNEALLSEHMLRNETDPTVRRFLLSEYLNGFRGTVFRQIMFAEFERAIYDMDQRREALTGDALSALYLGLLRDYHGHDAGVMNIDDTYSSEWAYIPHFYYRFYVYQYSSSHIASAALAEQILADGGGATAQRYIDNLLRAGRSKPPMEILKDAGVDLESSEPYEIAFGKFDRMVEELESLS